MEILFYKVCFELFINIFYLKKMNKYYQTKIYMYNKLDEKGLRGNPSLDKHLV